MSEESGWAINQPLILPMRYEGIEKIWQDELWPGRKLIEPRSAMSYLSGHDMANLDLPAFYYGMAIKLDDLEIFDGPEEQRSIQVVGVNSVHLCADGSLRSRGLFVYPRFRGRGAGTALLKKGLQWGLEQGATFAWSYPRRTSQGTYESAGFKITSDWVKSDTSDANAFCRYDY